MVAYNGTTYGALYTPFTASGSPVTLTATGLAIPTTTNQFDIGNLSDIVCGTFTVSSGTPYSEPFDAGLTVPALPSCWLAFDVDADTHTWVTVHCWDFFFCHIIFGGKLHYSFIDTSIKVLVLNVNK